MNAKEAYEKALEIGQNKELEDSIAKDSYFSYLYAINILHGRFEKGEDVIAKHFYYSYIYARDILQGRFEKGEDTIAKHSYCSYRYAIDVLHNRFKKGEKTILNSEYADNYKLIISIFEDKTKKLSILNMNHKEEDIRNACKWMLK